MIYLLLLLSLSTWAKTDLRPMSEVEIRKLIGPYPVSGSIEEKKEDQILLEYQKTRTADDCAKINLEKKTGFEAFYMDHHGPISKEEFKSIEKDIEESHQFYSLNKKTAKNIYQRPRPFVRNKSIRPCVRPNSKYSYPSGHTTLAYFWANLLIHIYPAKKEAILKRAHEIAMNRIIGGVHHPSDIEAGKKLGSKLAEIYLKQTQL